MSEQPVPLPGSQSFMTGYPDQPGFHCRQCRTMRKRLGPSLHGTGGYCVALQSRLRQYHDAGHPKSLLIPRRWFGRNPDPLAR